MKILYSLIFLFLTQICYPQVFEDVCITPDDTELKSAPLSDYIDISDEPIKHVRINLIFLRKNDGTGGFQENNPDHQQYINDLITNINSIYSSIPQSYDANCYNGNYGVYNDSKIRFDVNTMYIDNSIYWNNHNEDWCPDNQNYHLDLLNNQIVQNSQEPAINVFFTEDEPAYNNIVVNQNCPLPNNTGFSSVSCSQYSSENNLLLNQQVHMRNKFLKYYWMMNCVVDNNCQNPEWTNDPPTEEEVYGWLRVGRGLAHELGHSLDLKHVSHNQCNFCIEHLMMNKHCAWGFFLSPVEIGEMHRALSTGSARKYVSENDYSTTPYSITQNETWNIDKRIYRGIRVSNGAELEILDNIILPSETEITANNNSLLTIADSNITTAHTNTTLDINFQNAEVSVTNSTINNCSLEAESSILNIDNSTINLGNAGEFTVNIGSELMLNNSIIQ